MFILFLPRIMYHGLYYFLSIDDETNIHGGCNMPEVSELEAISGAWTSSEVLQCHDRILPNGVKCKEHIFK